MTTPDTSPDPRDTNPPPIEGDVIAADATIGRPGVDLVRVHAERNNTDMPGPQPAIGAANMGDQDGQPSGSTAISSHESVKSGPTFDEQDQAYRAAGLGDIRYAPPEAMPKYEAVDRAMGWLGDDSGDVVAAGAEARVQESEDRAQAARDEAAQRDAHLAEERRIAHDSDPDQTDEFPALTDERLEALDRAREEDTFIPGGLRDRGDNGDGPGDGTPEVVLTPAERYELALDRVAKAKYEVEAETGNTVVRKKGQTHKAQLKELQDAQLELSEAETDYFEAEGLSVEDAIMASVDTLEAVIERQAALAEKHDAALAQRNHRIRDGLVGFMSKKWVRGLVKWGIPAVAAAAILAGVAGAAFTGGASAVAGVLAGSALKAGIGASVGAGLGAGLGAYSGAVQARGQRAARNTAEEIRARGGDQVEHVRGMGNDVISVLGQETDRGDAYQHFGAAANEYVYGQALAERNRNRHERNVAMASKAGKMGLAGLWRGALTGAAVGIWTQDGISHSIMGVDGPNGAEGGPGLPGVENGAGNPELPAMTPEQIADAKRNLAEAYLNDPSQANNVAGLEKVGNPDAAASELAGKYQNGTYLWNKLAQAGNYNDQTLVNEFFVGTKGHASVLERLHDAGIQIDMGGQAHVTGGDANIHIDGNTYWIDSIKADHYVVDADGHAYHFEGTLSQPEQAALMDLVHKGGTILTPDQMADRLADQVTLTPDQVNTVVQSEAAKMATEFQANYHAVDSLSPSINASMEAQALQSVISSHASTFAALPDSYNAYFVAQLDKVSSVPPEVIAEMIRKSELALAA